MDNAKEEKDEMKTTNSHEENFSSYFVEPVFNEKGNLADPTKPPAYYDSVSISNRMEEKTPNAEHFLPGMSVNGSSNLPIPEVHPYAQSKKKRKRKRKNKVAAEARTEENKSTAKQQSDADTGTGIPSDLGVYYPSKGDIYPSRSPTALPPIASENFSNSLKLNSQRAEIVEEEKKIEMAKNGSVNIAFEDEKTKSPSLPELDFVNKREDALCFNDKVRKIDYVLVYKVSDEKNEDENEEQQTREIYQANLRKNGVEMEIEPEANSQDGKTCFIKLHLPWPILIKYAERMKVKMPLKVEKDENEEPDDELCDCSWFKSTKRRFLEPFKVHNELIHEKFGDQDYYTAEFTRDKIQYFDIKDEETFFSNAERSRICHRIMDETKYGNDRKDVGISRLLLDDAYVAAFPLHDGTWEKKIGKPENMRQLLYEEWARWRKFYKFQPLDAIRYYLGDKIGIYFAWLGFYTQMLWIPTIVGIICVLYSAGTLWSNVPVLEVCDDTYPTYAGNTTMCPLCDYECSYWKLSTSCTASMITYIFDNEATIFFAIFMSLWATMFLEFWKRHQFELTYRWDLVDYDEERDLVRPEYEALIERERFNPATGRMETVMDPKDRVTRTGFSVVTVVFWVCIIIAAVFSIIVYRVAMHAVFAVSLNPSELGVVGEVATPSLLTTITGSLISLLVIMILNKVYQYVAFLLTNWEIPRTRVEWEDSYTLKIFYFQFVNFYSYLFYIAFFKSTFVGYPEKYNYLFGRWRWEGCDSGGCMYELTIQLLIIMLGKQIWSNILELLLPWAMNKYRKYKSEKVAREDDNVYTRWEKDFDLAPLQLDLFYEYLEMVIQFGFVTLFVCAFPLAPLLALLNNIVEIRLDAIKFICEFRRPLALKCSDIGAWYFLLEFLGTLAVVTNAFTIAITSEAIPKLVYYYQYSSALYGTNTYVGFVNDSLSVFDVADFENRSIPQNPNPFPGETITQCRYRDYREPPTSPTPYAFTLQYWHVIAAKLAFVIVMEHLVFFLKKLLDYLIPDRPKKLNSQIKREYYLVQNMLLEAEKEEIIKEHRKNSKPASNQPVEEDQPITAEPGGGVTYQSEIKTTPM